MANIFSAFIYGIDAPGGTTEISAAGGQQNGFASAKCHVYPTTAVRGVAQVTCNSIIELLPDGLNQQSRKFYTDSTVSEVITAANA